MKNYEKANYFFRGFGASLILFIIISATTGDNNQNAIGTYQVELSESKLVILNTVTGEFILDEGVIRIGKGSEQFRKGKFEENYNKAKKH